MNVLERARRGKRMSCALIKNSIYTQWELGLDPNLPNRILGNQFGFIPKDTQRKFGYKLGIRPVNPLDFGYRDFLWMLILMARK